MALLVWVPLCRLVALNNSSFVSYSNDMLGVTVNHFVMAIMNEYQFEKSLQMDAHLRWYTVVKHAILIYHISCWCPKCLTASRLIDRFFLDLLPQAVLVIRRGTGKSNWLEGDSCQLQNPVACSGLESEAFRVPNGYFWHLRAGWFRGYGSSQFPLVLCNFHVLNDLLLIYICKLHWNLNRPVTFFCM